ncbi:hypothetical protein DYB32_005544 [Aphanomyces invadans]|uniref:EF-hand domain-containing protein n=1 Tax=Aphanomyces invadans TaxID=157072 RepID=A0A3R6VWE8_9STRA|nr:hypothetical protein DYB32_005544 [Aphanomyces invadans]
MRIASIQHNTNRNETETKPILKRSENSATIGGMLPDTVKDPVGYFVSASRPGDDGGYSKGVIKAYNEQHSTVLVRFGKWSLSLLPLTQHRADDGEEAWFGPDDKLTYLQQAIPETDDSHDPLLTTLPLFAKQFDVTDNGLTVDWLRVFSIPSKFQQLYDDDCRAECRIPDQEDFIQFLTKLIRNNMASVAASVYNYYDRATHLPRLWCYPRVHGSLHEWSSVPDPECHFIGYILTPRSTVHLPKHLTSADIQDIADLFTPDKSVVRSHSNLDPPEGMLDDAPEDGAGRARVNTPSRAASRCVVMDGCYQVLDEGEAPLRLLMALTHLRRIEVPPPPKSNPKNRRKSSKDHRVSLAIASAQQAVQALKATQAKHHTESTFQKHISDVNTITTYVSQNAQKLHDKVMQHAHTPLVLAPICTNLDDIVSSMQNTKHQSQQDREHVVLTNKERLEALEKRHQAAVEAKKQKWQQQCDAIEAAKQQKKREVHARNASKMARVHQERTALERRHDQDVRKLEQKVEKIMKSPRHSVAKPAIKPHPPPPKQTDAILPTPPATAMVPKHLTKGARPQSARVIRDRTIAFGNMVSKLHTVEVLVKKEQTKAMWRHLHSENKRFQPPAPSVAKCVDIEGETLHRTKLSFAPPAQRAITSLDLPLANEAACIKLASELIPPAVKPPDIDDDSSTSYCILAKYNRTLDEDQRQLFKARFSTNNVKLNHRLTFAVQEQYVHMARRNQAWGAFCASSRIYSDDPEQLKRTEFITVAKKLGTMAAWNFTIGWMYEWLGIVLRDDAEYETVCRRLDTNLTGFLAWRDFYEWFLDQDLKHAMGGVDRRVTSSSIS